MDIVTKIAFWKVSLHLLEKQLILHSSPFALFLQQLPQKKILRFVFDWRR